MNSVFVLLVPAGIRIPAREVVLCFVFKVGYLKYYSLSQWLKVNMTYEQHIYC